MKKLSIMLVLALLSVTIVSAVGCGGDGGDSAYKEMEAEAVALYETAQTDWDVLYEKIKKANKDTEQLILNAMGGNIAAVPPEQISGLPADTRALVTELDGVEAEFEALNNPEFMEYKGIDSYALYAEAMLKAIDGYRVLLELGAGFLEKIQPALASGDTAAINAAIQAEMATVTEIQAAQKSADEALAEAEKIRTTEQLGSN